MDFEDFKRTGHLNESIADKKVTAPFRVLSEEALSVAGIKVERVGVTYQELPDVQQHQLNTARRLHQLFPNAKIYHIVPRNLVLTLLIMVCRYLLEYVEVSNTYNFTVPNIILHIVAVLVISTGFWSNAATKKKD